MQYARKRNTMQNNTILNFDYNTDLNIIAGGDYSIPKELHFPDNGDPCERCLSVYVIAQNLNEISRTKLINCIASIKMQTFFNLEVCIINLDTDNYSKQVTEKIALDLQTEIIMTDGRNIAAVLDCVVKESAGKFVTFIDATDVIPRVRDVENAMYQLYTNELDFLTFTVKYQHENGLDFNLEVPDSLSTLNVNPNEHFSAYFKRNALLQYKFDCLAPFALDRKMVKNFEKDGKKGAYITGKTQMTLLGPIMQIQNYVPVPLGEKNTIS